LLDENSLIEEVFAAFGDTPIEAITGAMEQFCLCMLHPILAACCDCLDKEQVTSKKWKYNLFTTANLWSGNVALRSSSGIFVDTPKEWFGSVFDELRHVSIRKGYNWANLYCSRFNNGPLIASASLNQSEWAAGLEATTRLAWPKFDGFYGARLFVIVKR
jgi:hypothetical protein